MGLGQEGIGPETGRWARGLTDVKIQLVLYASLAQLLPLGSAGNVCDVEVRPGTTVADLLTDTGIALDSPKIVFVNGRHAAMDHLLSQGDRVAVFPPIAGG